MTRTVTFDEAVQALQHHFGYPSFRTGQDTIVKAVLTGRDTIAIMPTGGGKSICYQIPAILLDGLTLVVSPLISLMQDQVAALERARIPATFINSVIDYREMLARLEKARSGWYKLLYVAPERFESTAFVERIKGTRIDMVAVDEAHCISEWGHDFRPSYLRLKDAIAELGRPQIVALTATATPDVRIDVQTQLGLDNPEIIVRGFNRENLSFRVIRGMNKRDEIFRLCANGDCGIVYAGTRNSVEELARLLSQHGIEAEAYHAGLDSHDRAKVQERFMAGATRVIVATSAFGMGIDKRDVRFVIHHDMPSTIEQYYQEAGRAGRDGNESSCILLYHPKDRSLPEFFIKSTFPDRGVIQKVYSQLHHFAGNQMGQTWTGLLPMTPSALAAAMGGVSEAAVRGALDVLERDGYIRKLSERWSESTVRFLLDHETLRRWLIDSASAMSQPVLIALLRSVGSEAFHEPAAVFLDELADTLELRVNDVLPLLRELHNDRIIDFVPGRKGSGIALLGPRVPAQDLNIDFSAIERRMRHQLEKLQAMEHFILGTACRRNMVLEYFQETDIDGVCGKCDTCTSTVISFEDEETLRVPEESRRHILHCVAETGGRFGRLTIADILRGARTRRITQYRLFSAASYGRLRQYDKRIVLEAIDGMIGMGLLAKTDNMRPSVYITETGQASLGVDVTPMDLPTPEEAAAVEVENLHLYEALRAARRRAAARLNVPSHALLPDRVLRAIANIVPRNREDCLAVEGMGPVTFEKCGRELLAAIEDVLHEELLSKAMSDNVDVLRDLPASLRATWDLALRGLSLADIASQRGVTDGTVSNHISEILRRGMRLSVDALVQQDHQRQIRAAVSKLRDANLKRIKAIVDDTVTFAEIRIMLAVIEQEKRKS